MSYLKPQSPLQDKSSGNFFYPLTTVDQVIIPNNGRLSKIFDTTQNDNGKILKVVNGTPAWANIPNAEEASF